MSITMSKLLRLLIMYLKLKACKQINEWEIRACKANKSTSKDTTQADSAMFSALLFFQDISIWIWDFSLKQYIKMSKFKSLLRSR